MEYYLGTDVPTTSSKALLIHAAGAVIEVASCPHTLQTPKPLRSDQEPAEWWDAASASFRTVLGQAGVGAGAWPDVPTACDRTIRLTGQTEPVSEQATAYRKAYPLYRELYPELRSNFAELSAL